MTAQHYILAPFPFSLGVCEVPTLFFIWRIKPCWKSDMTLVRKYLAGPQRQPQSLVLSPRSPLASAAQEQRDIVRVATATVQKAGGAEGTRVEWRQKGEKKKNSKKKKFQVVFFLNYAQFPTIFNVFCGSFKIRNFPLIVSGSQRLRRSCQGLCLLIH